MSGGERSRAAAGIWWPSLLALAAFMVLIGLGTWQIERKSWKEALIASLVQRLAAAPEALPPPERWAALDPANDEFRRVAFAVAPAADKDALVYATGSTFRPDVSGPGYWVFTPVAVAGAVVVVNRGFVPEGQQAAYAPVSGNVQMIGALRWPEPRGWFTPKDDPARNLWFVRDHLAMADAKGWGRVAPFYIELETPSGGAGLPRAGRLSPNLSNHHLQYALTWYALAAALAIIFALWMRSRRRPDASTS